MSKTIDFPGHIRVSLAERLLQHLPLDEIVGQLIERTVEIIVHPCAALEHADQDLTVEPGVAVKREAGALSYENSVGLACRQELLVDLYGLVDNIMEYLELG